MATSVYVKPIAQAIADVAGALTTDLAPTVRAIRWAPRDTGSRPAAVVELPSIERTSADEAETQISTRDVILRFPVPFYFDLSDDLEFAQDQAVEVIEAFVDAVDAATNAGQPLEAEAMIGNAVVIDAACQVDPPEFMPGDESSARPAIRYVCRVDVLAFIPDV
jgi:hypothetical protein